MRAKDGDYIEVLIPFRSHTHPNQFASEYVTHPKDQCNERSLDVDEEEQDGWTTPYSSRYIRSLYCYVLMRNNQAELESFLLLLYKHIPIQMDSFDQFG